MILAPAPIQVVPATTTGTTISFTLAATRPGSSLVVCAVTSATPGNPTISGITLGGSADNFASVAAAGSAGSDDQIAMMWADPGCAVGQTALSVSLTTGDTGSANGIAVEWPGLVIPSPVDKAAVSANGASGSSWSSTATAATSQAAELAIGCVGAFNGSGIGTITGPSSPWANFTQENSASGHVGLLVGWQALQATGAVTYSGSLAASGTYAAIVATFKVMPVPSLIAARQAVKRAAYY